MIWLCFTSLIVFSFLFFSILAAPELFVGTDKNLYEIICLQESARETGVTEIGRKRKKEKLRRVEVSVRIDGPRQAWVGNPLPHLVGCLSLPSQERKSGESEHMNYQARERSPSIRVDQNMTQVSDSQLPTGKRNDEGERLSSEKTVAGDDATVDKGAQPQLPQLQPDFHQIDLEVLPLAQDLANDIDNIFNVFDF